MQRLHMLASWIKREYSKFEERPFDFPYPSCVAAAIVLLALVFSVIFLFFDYEVDSDVAKSYAYLLRAFQHREWEHFFNPNLPLLTPFLAALLRECFPILEPFQALVLLSGIYFSASVAVLYQLLYQNLNKHGLALLAALLFCCAPQTIRFAGNGWLEIGRNFYVILTIFLFDKQMRDFSVARSFILGVSLFALSLSRGEGIFFAIILLTVGSIALKRNGQLTGRRFAAGGMGPLVITFLFPVVFYSLMMYRITGFLVPDKRIAAIVNRWFSGNLQISPGQDLTVDYFTMSFGDAVNDFFSGGEYCYVIMALGGILLLICRKWRWIHTACLMISTVNFIGCLNTVTQSRYFTLNTPVLMIFTVTAAGFSYHLALSYLPKYQKTVKAAVMIGLAAMLMGMVDKGLSYLRRGDRRSREIGHFLHCNREKIWGKKLPFIYSSAFAYTTHVDCRILNRYLVQLPDLGKTDLLDGAVLPVGKKIKREALRQEMEKIRQRKDWERVPSPYDDSIAVYRRKRNCGIPHLEDQ